MQEIMTFQRTIARWVVKAYDLTPRWLSTRIVRLVNPSYLIGVVAVVFDADGNVLMLKHTYHRPRWRLPGGLLDAGEQPAQAAVRETAEEANCDIACARLVATTALRFSFDVAYLGRLLRVREFRANAEVAERRFVPPADWALLRPDQRRFVEQAYAIWQEERGGAGADGTHPHH